MFSTSQFATGCRRAAQSTLFSSARMKSTLRKGTTALQNKELSDEMRSFSSADTIVFDEQWAPPSRNIEDYFSKVDKDGNGLINKDEFTDAMRRVGLDQLNDLRNELSRKFTTTFDNAASIPISFEQTRSGEPETEQKEVGFGKTLAHRFQVTAEVIVSKIFPAGFAWQGASVLAENWGMSADSISFALTTGVGDGIGVMTGHTLYMMGKKAVTGNNSIDIGSELQTGLLLGSAAVFSGTAWQPIVNALTATGYGFNTAAAGTTVVCGLAFFGGLRVARKIYPQLGLKAIEPPSYANLKADATLSISIGGATGCFVGTDILRRRELAPSGVRYLG